MLHWLCRPPPSQGKDSPPANSRGQRNPGKCLRISPATLPNSRSSHLASVLCSRSPGWLTDLLGYMAQIAKARQRFKWSSWVIYDHNFRQEAASRDSTDWAQQDPSLFAQCFISQAKKNKAWYKVCHLLDHSSDQCPTSPSSCCHSPRTRGVVISRIVLRSMGGSVG